jgi:hypothetical protein
MKMNEQGKLSQLLHQGNVAAPYSSTIKAIALLSYGNLEE